MTEQTVKLDCVDQGYTGEEPAERQPSHGTGGAGLL